VSSGARWALLALVMAVCVGFLVYTATRSSAEYYRTIPEARAAINSSADVRVLGTVQDDLQRLQGGEEVRFTAAAGGDSMPVAYSGPVPDIFRPGVQVVLEGHIDASGVFQARTLLAKCPSRFTATSAGPG
jgi:cytochrome c-type biogenesis protein CcmE